MKGLLYDYFLSSRSYFIGAGIVAAVLTTLWTLVLNLLSEEVLPLIRSFLPIFALVITVIATEGCARYLEKLQKTHFLNHILSSRVSRGGFTLALLVMNLLSLALGVALVVLMFVILGLSNASLLTPELFGSVGIAAMIFGAVDFAVFFPTLLLKSAEKGGMIIGLILGFGVVFPCLRIFEDGLVTVDFTALLNDPMSYLIAAAVGVGIYALSYAAILLRLKRGDVC